MKLFKLTAIASSLIPLLFLCATPTLADSPDLQAGQEEVVLKVDNMT